MKPEKIGFTSPMKTSSNESACHAVVQYWLKSSRNMKVETTGRPHKPTRSEMIDKKNNITTDDTTRGVTSFFIGSVPSARMASICSVTCMEPNSLAMPLALRPATINPVSTGPSSRTIDNETSCPVNDSAPNLASEFALCKASTAPVKNPVSTTIGSEP